MTEQEIINKARKALQALGLYGSEELEPYVMHVTGITDPVLLEYIGEEAKHSYSVVFPYALPDGRHAAVYVDVDKETHRLNEVITQHSSYAIPEEFC